MFLWSVCTITFLTKQYVPEFFHGLNLPFWGSVQLFAIECQRSSFLHILVHMEGFIKPWEGQLHIFADDLLDFLKCLLLFLTPFSRDFLIREGCQGR
jgi:hypothetical protein